MNELNIPPGVTKEDIDRQFGDEPISLTLNWQQVELLKSLLVADCIRADFSNTSKAIAEQIIRKMEDLNL